MIREISQYAAAYHQRDDELRKLQKAVEMRPRPLPKARTRFLSIVVYQVRDELICCIKVGDLEVPCHMWTRDQKRRKISSRYD